MSIAGLAGRDYDEGGVATSAAPIRHRGWLCPEVGPLTIPAPGRARRAYNETGGDQMGRGGCSRR